VSVALKGSEAMLPMLKTVLKSLVSKPATVEYPKVPKINHEIVRGSVTIDIEDCIFCGMCQRKCPSGAINVKRTEKLWEIERFACVVCAACVEACPKKCLHMNSTLMTAKNSRFEKDVFLDARIPGDTSNN